jgi:two-component sensor histidine kinase
MVLYDKLYRSMDRQALSVRDYLPGLLEEILANFPGGREIQVVSEIEDFCLGAEVLQPLGIIVNELVTNAMKYAFPRRSRGSIFLSVTRTGPRVRVAFRDDGEGVPPGFDPRAAAGFGLSLVRLLADSLRARLAFEPGAGLGVVLEFDT